MGEHTVITTHAPQQREAALQARWAAGEWRGQSVRASDGASYTILYQGRPGGGAGPDFRDAVLARADQSAQPTLQADQTENNGASAANDSAGRLYGDIELHLKASDWRAHGHAHDPRYNNLALHVIFDDVAPHQPQSKRGMTAKGKPPATQATTLASGKRIPQAHLTTQPVHAPENTPSHLHWPCVSFTTRLTSVVRRDLLLAAGLARFTEKGAMLRRALHQADTTTTAQGPPDARSLSNLWPNRRQLLYVGVRETNTPPMRVGWSQADRVLWLALAEGLGYGRDRAALRALGEALLPSCEQPQSVKSMWGTSAVWEAAALQPLQRVERLRLRGLLAWRLRWEAMGPWAALRLALQGEDTAEERGELHDATLADRAMRRLLAALRVGGGAVSLGRAVILAANVALPFATAWAETTSEEGLAALACAVYLALPGAPSNQITREMARQLGLRHAPSGAAAQQGLHHIWATHCRMKDCALCPCAAEDQRDGSVITTTCSPGRP